MARLRRVERAAANYPIRACRTVLDRRSARHGLYDAVWPPGTGVRRRAWPSLISYGQRPRPRKRPVSATRPGPVPQATAKGAAKPRPVPSRALKQEGPHLAAEGLRESVGVFKITCYRRPAG